MLRSLLLAVIAALISSPLASAQTLGPCASHGSWEINVGIDRYDRDERFRVRAWTSDGTERLDIELAADECLNLETNGNVPVGGNAGSNAPADTSVYRNLYFGPDAADLLLTIELSFLPILPAVDPPPPLYLTYDVCNDRDPDFGFYCSRNGASGEPSAGHEDLNLIWDVPRGMWLVRPVWLPLALHESVADYFPGEEGDWLLPYNNRTACELMEGGSCTADRIDDRDVFLTPQHGGLASNPVVTPAVRDWTFADHDVTVPSQHTGAEAYLWDLGTASVHFQPGRQLVVEGEIAVDGMTLDAADAAQGWHGIRADGADADLTLDGATLDGVVYPTPPNPNAQFPPYAALTATDSATVSVQGLSVIQNSVNANGVVAALSGTSVSISGASQIQDHDDGLGVLASAGATVELSGINTFVRENGLGGVFATGSGSEIDILPGASVEDNDGAYGATANVSGTIQLLTPASSPSLTGTTGNPTVQNNTGGLDTRTSAYVYTGQNGVTGCSPGTASVSLNNLSDEDARANSASIITAECTYWNGRTSQAQLDLTSGGTSSITVAPLSATLSLTGGTSSFKSAGGSASARDGEALPAAEARRLAASGDASAASALLSETLLTETDADTRTALLSAAVYVAARGLSPLLRAQLATTAAGGGAESDWARHALAVDAMQRGAEDAWARAEALSRIAGHRAAGHTLMLRQAMATETGARDALAAFAAIPERDADEEEALTAALAVVAAAYPDVDLAAALRDGGAPITEAKTGTAPAAATLAAYPNPSAGAARVALALAEAAEATVAVYDALGRRVATLHQGALDAGDHAFALPGDTLAPGVYVVTAQTAGSGGATHREAVRWTRMR